MVRLYTGSGSQSLYVLCDPRHPQPAPRLTWVVPLQQVPAVESSAFGVAHLQALLQQPLRDVALADACAQEGEACYLNTLKTSIYFMVHW